MTHGMLAEGDHLLVGLSGGKDSYLLLETLADRKKSFRFHFDITAVHVEVKNLGINSQKDFMKDFCKRLNIPLIISEIEVDFQKDKKKAPCFVCAWNKRKEIFRIGKELRSNKLAFGHHRDDALETLLMNMVYHGSISSLPYMLSLFNNRVRLIRPLLDIYEKELEECSQFRNYKIENNTCPYNNITKRQLCHDILDDLNNRYSKAKINLFKAMSHIYDEYLPKNK